MTRTRIFAQRIADAWGVLESAARAAAAVRGHRSPAPHDLERLGISAVAFGAINRN
jgi:hypothetical protein